MTPHFDIVIVTLPSARGGADKILDGLMTHGVAKTHRTRLVIADPAGAGWAEAETLAGSAICTIFCWDAASSKSEAFRTLAERCYARSTAISVELEAGASPAAIGGVAVYPLHGWLGGRAPVARFLFGQSMVLDIAAAAQEKMLGRDPPAPSAMWRLVRKRGWVVLLTIASFIGTASTFYGYYESPKLAKWLDPTGGAALQRAKAAASCDALRQIARDEGSAWSSDARETLTQCVEREVVTRRPSEAPLPLYVDRAGEAAGEADRLCRDHARITQSRLTGVRATPLRACGVGQCGTITCLLDQPISERREYYGNTPAGSAR